ncbi:hypothetical protein BV22DRAFT_1052768, partial [Leucogyrophana mollusca]
LVPYIPRVKPEAPQLTLGEPQFHFPSDFTTTTVTTSRSQSTASFDPRPLDLADGSIPASVQRAFQHLCEEARKCAREERSMGSMNEDNTYHCAHVAHAVVSNDDGPELVHKPAYCDAGRVSPIHPPSYSTIVSPSMCFLPTVEKDDTHKTFAPYEPHDTSDFATDLTDSTVTTPTSTSIDKDDITSNVTGQTTPEDFPVLFDSVPGLPSYHVSSIVPVLNVTRDNVSNAQNADVVSAAHMPTSSATTPTCWSNASTPYFLTYPSPHATPPPASSSPSVDDRDVELMRATPYRTIPQLSFNSFDAVHDPIRIHHLEFQVHYVLCELENIVIRDAGEHGYARLRDFPASLYSRFDPYNYHAYVLRGTFQLLRQRVSDLRYARRLLLDLKNDLGATLTPGQVRECNDPLCQIFYFDNGICEFTDEDRYEFFVQRAPACNPLLTHYDIAFFRTATGFL